MDYIILICSTTCHLYIFTPPYHTNLFGKGKEFNAVYAFSAAKRQRPVLRSECVGGAAVF